MAVTKRKYTRLANSQWAEIDGLWELGDVTLPELADRFGVTTRTLQAHFEKHGVEKGSKGREIVAEIKAEVFSRAKANMDDFVRLATETRHRAYVHAVAVEDLLVEQLQAVAKTPAEAYRTATNVKTLSLTAQAFERLFDLKSKALGLDKDDRADEELPEIVFRDITAAEIEDMRREQEEKDPWGSEIIEDDDGVFEGVEPS